MLLFSKYILKKTYVSSVYHNVLDKVSEVSLNNLQISQMKAESHLVKEAWNAEVYISVLQASPKESAFESCLLHVIMYQMAC